MTTKQYILQTIKKRPLFIDGAMGTQLQQRDDKIVDILKNEGIDIARRTVAKYRDALHIPSSVQRRKEKKNL